MTFGYLLVPGSFNDKGPVAYPEIVYTGPNIESK